VRDKIDIMIAGRSKAAIGALEHKVAGSGFNIIQRHISNGHSNPLYGLNSYPDILIFHLSAMGEEEITSLLETSAETRPATIIIGPANNTKCMRLAMQAGVRDFLEDPLDDAELGASIRRICTDLDAAVAGAAAGLGTIMTAVVSTKGGCGASFLAVNLAHVMAAEDRQRVALVELDLQFGSLAHYLNLKPKHGLVNALDLADQLDTTALEAYMVKHKSGLALLGPLEEEMIMARDIDSARFSQILDLLRSSYSRIVVDLPRQIDDLCAEVYERADRILLVTQQEFASIKDAARLRKLIMRELAVPADRISMVVNRYDKNSSVELADMARSIGVEKNDLILIPSAYKAVAESINIGVPMLDHARGSSVTKAIIDMSKQLQGMRPKEQRGVMGRMLSNLIGG
jgi:pilus assembly protein CpaE